MMRDLERNQEMTDLPDIVRGFKVWFASGSDRDDLVADLMYDHETWGEMDVDPESGKLVVRLYFSPEDDNRVFSRVLEADGLIETLTEARRGLHKRGIGNPDSTD